MNLDEFCVVLQTYIVCSCLLAVEHCRMLKANEALHCSRPRLLQVQICIPLEPKQYSCIYFYSPYNPLLN